MAVGGVPCWDDKTLYFGFSWHSEVSDLVEKAFAILSAAQHKRKSSVDWTCSQWLKNGIFLKWKAPATFQAGYFYFYRLLKDLSKEGAKLRGWYVVGHKGDFAWATVSDALTTRAEIAEASLPIVPIPAPIAEALPRRRCRTKTPANTFLKPAREALVAGMRTALTQEQDTAVSTWLAMKEGGLQAKECVVLAMMKGAENLHRRAPHYSCHELLGEGSFGQVYRGSVGPFAVAIKCLKGADLQEAMAEAYVLERCSGHANVVQLLDAYAQPVVDRFRVHLVFELCGLDLGAIVYKGGLLSPQELRLAVSDVRTALDFLHSSVCVIHSDVKPSNILCVDVQEASGRLRCYKLADLGSCVEKDPAARSELQCKKDGIKLSTLPYRAFELMCGDRGFGPGIDSWSLAVVFAELAGHVFTLVANHSVRDTMERIEVKLGTPSCLSLTDLPGYQVLGGMDKGSWPAHLHQALGRGGVKLLERLLDYDKNKRTAFPSRVLINLRCVLALN